MQNVMDIYLCWNMVKTDNLSILYLSILNEGYFLQIVFVTPLSNPQLKIFKIWIFSMVFKPNSNLHSPQKGVYTNMFIYKACKMLAKSNLQKEIFLELTAWEIGITKPVLFTISFFLFWLLHFGGMNEIAHCRMQG